VYTLLRTHPAALAASSSTDTDDALDGARKPPASRGANPSRLAPRPAAVEEEQ
jgi:hypothetical protein